MPKPMEWTAADDREFCHHYHRWLAGESDPPAAEPVRTRWDQAAEIAQVGIIVALCIAVTVAAMEAVCCQG